MTCVHVAVATSHKQICAVAADGSAVQSSGGEAEAIILSSGETARQLMLVVCCIMHLHIHSPLP